MNSSTVDPYLKFGRIRSRVPKLEGLVVIHNSQRRLLYVGSKKKLRRCKDGQDMLYYHSDYDSEYDGARTSHAVEGAKVRCLPVFGRFVHAI